MRNILALIAIYLVRFSLWFRYKVTVKGLDNLNLQTLNKPGGVLFLPNHPTVFVDPTLVTLAIWKKFPIRPMIVEYMYYMPIVNTIMRFMNAIPVPNFVASSNSLKKKKADQVFEVLIESLKKKDNFLVYPAGKTKHQAREIINASGVHRVIQAVPEANVVLVRTTGLWGSRFSRALTGGRTPAMFPTIFWGIKKVFTNLLFFTPRRHVTIEFVPAPADFPYQASRLEMNRWLEKWYNRPDGIKPQEGEEPGESLNLVSYSMWRKEIPQISESVKNEEAINLAKIPVDVQEKVKKKLSEMTHIPVEDIKPEFDLGADLGLDSLDNAEILTFLDNEFDLSGVPVNDLTSVGKIMALASKQVGFGDDGEEIEEKDISKWFKSRSHDMSFIPEGNTIHECFLNRCQLTPKTIACGDAMAGALTYEQAKLRVVLLAEAIRHLPGEYIGILLPSSVAAYLTVLACQLAGKVPLMVNWTIGSRHLESVISLSHVKVVLSSWAFLDRLDNVDLNGVEDLLLTLEDVRRNFTLRDKLTAFYRSKLSTQTLLKIFGVREMTTQAQAVLLFTSGTESQPKGVPLSHANILSNQRGAIQEVGLYQDDVLLGMLPPFHSFGFTVSGLLPLLAGIRVAYYPDPTDGKGVAHTIERWRATLTCGAPTFLKGIFKNAKPEQLQSLRLCFTGAEKAPEELFQMVNQLGHCRLLEGYGITECSPVLTINATGDARKGVGKPLPGTDLCIVSVETHEPVNQGERGLVLAKGPNIFGGYLNHGLSSPFILLNGSQWYSTGDLGYLSPDGSLILSGRLKRFIKIGGEMISLAAIEDTLQKAMGQKAGAYEGAALAVCAKEEPGEKTKIYVFTCFPVLVEELNKALREAGFSNLTKISKVIQIPEIPLMGTGKTNYRALDAQLNDQQTPKLVETPC